MKRKSSNSTIATTKADDSSSGFPLTPLKQLSRVASFKTISPTHTRNPFNYVTSVSVNGVEISLRNETIIFENMMLMKIGCQQLVLPLPH